MRLNREDVFRVVAENDGRIRALGVRKLALFGSCARADNTEASDLDFLVEFEHRTFDAYTELKFLLEELMGCEVDLVIIDALKPRLREPVLREAVHAPGF